MAAAPNARFPIRFDRAYRVLSTALLLPPSRSWVELDADELRVQMGWSFRARFARSVVASVAPYPRRPISRGVHGFAGRWLVNGSADGILSLELEPPQRAFVLGFPVRLRTLLVGVEDPAGLAAALGHPG